MTNKLPQCTTCGHDALVTSLSLPTQPLSNQFIDATNLQVPKVEIELGSCSKCGVIQLTKLPDIKQVRPIYDWLIYNEPEGHLDNVVDNLQGMNVLSANSVIVGATYKDESTLARLQSQGYTNTSLIDYSNLQLPYGLETIQAVLSDENSACMQEEHHHKADVLIARHIVEHAHDAQKMLKNLSKLVKDKGLLILEYPESSTIFAKGNYAFLWEEHISYFTTDDAPTIANCIGAKLLAKWQYSYTFEDSVVIVLQVHHQSLPQQQLSANRIETQQNMLSEFSRKFPKMKQQWQDKLADIVAGGDQVSVFGAGHLSIKFINFFELSPYITAVVDDNPNKIGKRMPGSDIPIISSSSIEPGCYLVCISTLSPESKIRALSRNQYLKSGITLLDAFYGKGELDQ